MSVAKATPASAESCSCLKPEARHGREYRQLLVCAKHLTRKNLKSVEPLGGRVEPNLTLDFVGNSTKGGYKPGLLVSSATAKVFVNPWSTLIDSGASGNYVRRRFLDNNQ